MKKLNVIKFSVIGIAGYLLVCGYHAGPAANGYDCTGAETGLGNEAGCTVSGGGCHATAATPAITVALELDSAGGKPTNYYVGGGKYTIKITGTNTGTTSQPDFGFQIASIKGSVAATTPTSTGTFTAATGTHVSAPQSGNFVLSIVEQSNTIKATSGSGGNGTTYVESITWTAPAKGTGAISFWGVINAVNGNGTNDKGDLWNTNHIDIAEITPTGIASVADNNATNVYPNPFSTSTTFSLANEVNNATISLYDITGKEVKQINFSGKQVTLDRGMLTSGIYFYTIVNEDQSTKTGKLIIQ
jgi:hypothetical protein